MPHASAIVVGAGMLGIALARALALRGRRVVVFERNERAVGASLRNAGAVTPLAVADAREREQARRSRAVWREFCEAADVWHDPCGSLVPAYDADEWALLQEQAAAAADDGELLDAAAARRRCAWIGARGLRGAWFSADDLLVDPRVALRRLPDWLAARHEIEFRWKHVVTRIDYPYVWSGGRRHAADRIYVAGGADTAGLLSSLPEMARPSRRPRLLLRLAAQNDGFRLGTIVANVAALSRGAAAALPAALRLRERCVADGGGLPDLRLVQSGSGELLADAAFAADDDDAPTAQRRVLDALRRLVELPDCRIQQAWTLPHLAAADATAAVEAAPGVTAVAAPGPAGLGLTTAFAFAEDVVAGAVRARPADVELSARRA